MVSVCSVLTALTFFIMPAQTTLYDAETSPIVDLPTGYFLLRSDAPAPNGFIAVIYDDLTGFVKEAEVDAVDYTPVNKYETKVTFKCANDGQPVNLRKSASKSSEVLTVMPDGASGRCYGSTHGDALIVGGGNDWYYVNYNGTRGYCYYAHVSVDPTPPNIIEKEDPPEDEEPSDPTDAPPTQATGMSKTTAIIFIVALCIPVPFIMFYLFKKPKSDK